MAIHCEPVCEETSRPCPPRHDGLPRRPFCPPRNDKECVVIVRAKPVAIHCEPVCEETSRPCPPRHDGLPRRPFCPPRNDKECVVIVRAKPVAIHCEPVCEETSRPCPPRHDGLPCRTCVLLAMTKKWFTSYSIRSLQVPGQTSAYRKKRGKTKWEILKFRVLLE